MTATAAWGEASRWYRNTWLCLGVTVTAGISLLLVGDVDPFTQMLSNSIRTVPGAVLLAVAACSLATAGGWLLMGVLRTLPRVRLLSVLLTVWSLSLVAVAIFPTNLPGTHPGVSAEIHRASAGLVAALPPLIALIIARQADHQADTPRVRRLRTAGWATLAAAVTFGAANTPAAFFGQDQPPETGLSERLLLMLVLVVIGLSARVLEQEERIRWA